MAGQPEGREPAIHLLMALRALDGRPKGGHDKLLMDAALDQSTPMP